MASRAARGSMARSLVLFVNSLFATGQSHMAIESFDYVETSCPSDYY